MIHKTTAETMLERVPRAKFCNPNRDKPLDLNPHELLRNSLYAACRRESRIVYAICSCARQDVYQNI